MSILRPVAFFSLQANNYDTFHPLQAKPLKPGTRVPPLCMDDIIWNQAAHSNEAFLQFHPTPSGANKAQLWIRGLRVR